MNTNEPTYPLTYDIHHHAVPLTKADIPKGRGACDALTYISVLEHDNDYSYVVQSINGKQGGLPMDPRQEFQVWLMMAEHLSKILPEGGPRDLVAEVIRIVDASKKDNTQKEEV